MRHFYSLKQSRLNRRNFEAHSRILHRFHNPKVSPIKAFSHWHSRVTTTAHLPVLDRFQWPRTHHHRWIGRRRTRILVPGCQIVGVLRSGLHSSTSIPSYTTIDRLEIVPCPSVNRRRAPVCRELSHFDQVSSCIKLHSRHLPPLPVPPRLRRLQWFLYPYRSQPFTTTTTAIRAIAPPSSSAVVALL